MLTFRHLRRPLLHLLAAGVLTVASLSGCAGTGRRVSSPGGLEWQHPRVAALPLDNMSSKPDAGDILGQVVFSELVRTGSCEVVDAGQVESSLSELGIRASNSMTSEQVKQVGEKLKVRYLLVGTVLESGTVRGTDGDLPSISLAMRLLDAVDGRVAWASIDTRTGEERETVFGWGREKNPQRVASDLVAGMLGDLMRASGQPVRRLPAAPARRTATPAPAMKDTSGAAAAPRDSSGANAAAPDTSKQK